jgi:hypothetical protein
MKVSRFLVFEIILIVIVFILIIIYYLQSRSDMPFTQVYLTNTSIIGKVFGG